MLVLCLFFFFKQKTAYEMRISDWSSDVCSSDLMVEPRRRRAHIRVGAYAFGQHRQMIGLPQVIGIEEGDPVAGRRPNADIAPGIAARSRRREIEPRDPRLPGGGRHFAPAAGRPIIPPAHTKTGKHFRERDLHASPPTT